MTFFNFQFNEQAISALTPVAAPALHPLGELATLTIGECPWPKATLTLDESQEAALAGLLREQYACLIGAAGTGKTTVTLRLVQALLEANPEERIIFGSYTGRAVQQLKRALPIEFHEQAATLHSHLEYAPKEVNVFNAETGAYEHKRRFVPQRTALLPLRCTTVIIDEAGMLPIELWNKLWEALRDGTRIYFIGDINQLPPAFGGSALGWALRVLPSFALTTIHRQAADSAVITAANAVLNGEPPPNLGEGTNSVRTVKLNDNLLTALSYTKASIAKLYKAGHFDPAQDIIITPTNGNPLGQLQLNTFCSQFFNPSARNERILIQTGIDMKLMAVEDRVMLLANDNELGLTNGMIGIIRSIRKNAQCRIATVANHIELSEDALATAFSLSVAEGMTATAQAIEQEAESQYDRQASHIVTVEFTIEAKDKDGNRTQITKEAVFSTAGDFNKLGHGYASTCHKAQGGEYRNVLIVMNHAAGNLLNREWLYTAITRAKQRVWILATNRALLNATQRQSIQGKTMAEKLEAFALKVTSGKCAERPHYLTDLWIEHGLAVPNLEPQLTLAEDDVA